MNQEVTSRRRSNEVTSSFIRLSETWSFATSYQLFNWIKIRELAIAECDAYGQSKAKHKIHKSPRDLHEGLGYSLAINFHDSNKAMGFNFLVLVADGPTYAGTTTFRNAKPRLSSLSSNIYSILKRQYHIEPMKSTMNSTPKNPRQTPVSTVSS